MQDFKPHRIFIHPKVQDLPVTKRILKYFSGVPTELAESPQSLKQPQEHTLAKRELFLTAHQGQAIKTCQGLGDYVCCQYYTIALISDCHLECTYCILQDYLKNNPRLTIFCNTDDIFEAVAQKAQQHPERLLRVGTGELSDSLALDHITQFSKDFVAFAQNTKTCCLNSKPKRPTCTIC